MQSPGRLISVGCIFPGGALVCQGFLVIAPYWHAAHFGTFASSRCLGSILAAASRRMTLNGMWPSQ